MNGIGPGFDLTGGNILLPNFMAVRLLVLILSLLTISRLAAFTNAPQ